MGHGWKREIRQLLSPKTAQTIFKKVCPDEEFLPKPPHPDDIIYVDDEQTTAAGAGSEEWTGNKDDDTKEGKEENGVKPKTEVQ
nr:hypothetical protein BaRGS_002100 [Batillaria attramentaria]